MKEDLELEKVIYHKGYREGFEGALKLVHSILYRLKYEVKPDEQLKVQKAIDDLMS